MKILIDFPLILTVIVLVSGLVSLLDVLFLAKRRRISDLKPSWLVEYSRSFFPALLLVLLVRSFVIQPYRVPTGSLEPTVLPGDFILVNQFAYGLHLPVLNTKIVNVGEPKVGDIALFRFPENPSLTYVKRVIGVPGDHVVYKNKSLTINGRVMQQMDLGMALDQEYAVPSAVKVKQEVLPTVTHKIFIRDEITAGATIDVNVPSGYYFVMGDNRDNSDDSRHWGFVPESNLVGKAFAIWMSWDSQNHAVRWSRIGKAIK